MYQVSYVGGRFNNTRKEVVRRRVPVGQPSRGSFDVKREEPSTLKLKTAY